MKQINMLKNNDRVEFDTQVADLFLILLHNLDKQTSFFNKNIYFYWLYYKSRHPVAMNQSNLLYS